MESGITDSRQNKHLARILKEIQRLARQAALFPEYGALLEETRRKIVEGEANFDRSLEERRVCVEELRCAFDRVAAGVEREFASRSRVRRIDEADARPLESFLKVLGQKGVTRWWNDLRPDVAPSPDRLVACLDADSPGEVGMSDAVQETFRKGITGSKRRELAALPRPLCS